MPEPHWPSIRGIAIQIGPAAAGRQSAGASWRNGTIALALPVRLSGGERARLYTLLVWGVLGRLYAPYAADLARRMNESSFRSRLDRVCFHHQNARWGSCTEGGAIYLSHRLIAAPGPLAVPVLWHELAHLDCMSHGPRFWQRLAEVDPYCRSRRAELASFGRAWADWWEGIVRELAADNRAVLNPPEKWAGNILKESNYVNTNFV